MTTITPAELDEIVVRSVPHGERLATCELVASMLPTDIPPSVIGAICCVPVPIQPPQLGTSLRVALGGDPAHHQFRRSTADEIRMRRSDIDVAADAAAFGDPRSMLRTIATATGRWSRSDHDEHTLLDDGAVHNNLEERLIDWISSQEHFRAEGYRIHPTAFRSRLMDASDAAIANLDLVIGLDADPWREIHRIAREAPAAARRMDIERIIGRIDAQTAFVIGAIQSSAEDAVLVARLFGPQSVAAARKAALTLHRSPNITKDLTQRFLDALRDWFRDGLDDYVEALRSPATAPMGLLAQTLPAGFAHILAARPGATLSDLDTEALRMAGIGHDSAQELLEDLKTLSPTGYGILVAQTVRVLREHGPDPARLPGGVVTNTILTPTRRGRMVLESISAS